MKLFTFILMLVIICTSLQAQNIAYSSFEEANTGEKYFDTGDSGTDHPLINNPGQADVNYVSTGNELGFSSYYYNTLDNVGLTDGDFVGVTDFASAVGAFTDGSKGFQMSDCDGLMVTSFDTVDVSAFESVQISLDYFVNEEGWEDADYIRIWIVTEDDTEIEFLNTDGSDIDDLDIEGEWKTIIGSVEGYNKIVLKLGLQSNAGFEAVYFDNIQIKEGGSINVPPVIKEVASGPKVPMADQSFSDSVKVTDEGTLVKVQLQYRLNMGDTVKVDMTQADSLYIATIDESVYDEGNVITYWIYAEDDGGETTETDPAGFIVGTNSISDIKQLNEDLELIYDGYYARTSGVATVDNGVFDKEHLSVYIQDENFAGINVFRYDAVDREILAGHNYTVVGQLIQYNGLTQITPDSASSDITDNGEAVLPEPLEVTIATLLAGAESFEGLLIKVLSADTTMGTDPWPEIGENGNMTISDDGGSSLLELRIDKDTDITANPQPAWPQNIIGLFTQYDFSSPYDSFYQITPRSISDFSDLTAIENIVAELPAKLRLYDAYPNPFNPQTTLRFDLPANLTNSKVDLAIFNSLGQKVKTITESAIAGRNTFKWNAQNQYGQRVASGIYYAILRVDKHQQAVKLVLLK